ncbi:MAG TPA: peptidyl-alpha-hydroxyglycine alpha-amidating lyase family protein [Bryobacteraceae bacterium]|nr:peptidyl-alpha-hydroxyglycine alpha-amidating lyase family protein [Bryobacteraceae bacterium]
MNRFLIFFFSAAFCFGQIQTGPPLPYHVVEGWPQLPTGWNFGEVAAVDVDKADNVWVFSDGPHPVMEFDSAGKFLRAWPEFLGKKPHGLRVGPDGNIWTVDLEAHRVMKWTPEGRLLMNIGTGSPAADNNARYAFNRPATLNFGPAGDFFVADGYGNSRVAHYSKDGEYLSQWGSKGSGDGQFNLVHDIAIDRRGRLYVTDRLNKRVQIFDSQGRFLGKWTDLGVPQGLYYAKDEDALYMCDGENSRIIKVDLNGHVLGVLGSFGKVPGKLDTPHYIAIDSKGNLYSADFRNWRVDKFAKNKR